MNVAAKLQNAWSNFNQTWNKYDLHYWKILQGNETPSTPKDWSEKG